MRENTLRKLFAQGVPALNSWHSIPSAYLVEGAAQQGFDSMTIDLQHGMIGFENAVAMLQAISIGSAVPLVRVPANHPDQIMRMLDAGAYGIVCPMISTLADAEAFASACRYPPVGTRSFGPARGLLYGGADYVAHANSEILTIPMIETAEAIENVSDIVALEQIDMLYVGPNDLALALGEKPGAERLETSRTTEAIRHIREVCAAAGKPVGIFCGDTELSRQRIAEGFDLVTPGNDFGIATKAMASALAELRPSRVAVAGGTGY
ncbi:HpcH/HpaI aldolase family protein [Mesobacterium pallidum]|uniref:HpcH/HpaI aldolase family protein n=1 Tax=Mesobacterium pallidum TaxID=2872037 RepID=UPI001EE254AE|nr:aldolase/citrate lyase family protein [Mesobacterium pallidum]